MAVTSHLQDEHGLWSVRLAAEQEPVSHETDQNSGQTIPNIGKKKNQVNQYTQQPLTQKTKQKEETNNEAVKTPHDEYH